MASFFSKHKQETILGILICLYLVYFTTATFLRYDNFYTGRFDLGNMDQTVWNTINGRIFQTSTDSGIVVSRLSGHADFILILLSPFYLLWSNPKMLLLIQSIALSFGAVFVFLIARNILNSKNLAVVFGFLFLMNPAIQFTNLYDFHGVTIATTTLLASFYFLLKKKYFPLSIFLLLSGLAKEQIWLTTSIFGLFLLFKTGEKKLLGLGIMLFSLTIFVYLVWIAIPQSAEGQHFALPYYSDFGNSPGEIVKNVFLSPREIFLIVSETNRLNYLKQLLAPLGFISLLSPIYLIFVIPDLLIKLLSNNPQLYQIYYQYSATITPFIFISAIFGGKQFIKWFPQIPKFHIATYLIFCTLLSAYFFGPLPGAKDPNLDMFVLPRKNKVEIENFLSGISEEYSVAATNNLGSHLSHRQSIATIPLGVDTADYVLFLINNLNKPQTDLQKEALIKVENNKNYIRVFEKDGFIVFKKQGNLL